MDYSMLLNRKQCRQIFAGKALKEFDAERGRAQPNSSTLFSDTVLTKANEGASFFSVNEYNELLGINTQTTQTVAPTVPNLLAQAVWATYFDSSGFDSGNDITIDSSGNIYITGAYTSSTNITLQNVNGNGQTDSSVTLPSTVSRDAFLIKYNSSGQVQWATCINGTSGDDSGNSLSIDSIGNIYVTGSYYRSSGNVILKSASGNTQINSSITLPSTSNTDMFLIKYNSSGQVQWATCLNGSGNSTDNGYGIALDSSDNIYITGNYKSNSIVTLKSANGNTQVNSLITLPATLPSTASFSVAAFLIKYNSSGQVQWATCIDGNSTSYESGTGITLDSSNNIYISGVHQSFSTITLKSASGNSQIDSSVTLPPIAGGFTASFLIKYNNAGQVQWATYLDGIGNTGDAIIGIITDSIGNIYITGDYDSNNILTLKSASGNSQIDSTITLPAVSVNALFLVKYNSAGQVQWATYLDGTPNGILTSYDRGSGIVLDSIGNIYITGYYQSTTAITLKNANGNSQIDSTVTLPATPIDFRETHLIKYNSSGQVQWATYISGNMNSSASSIALDSSGNIYITGIYESSSLVTLKNASGNSQTDSLVTVPSTTSQAVFVVKYTQP
jgi:hypothetical protein